MLVALSGGADSLALAAAVAFEVGVSQRKRVGSAGPVRSGTTASAGTTVRAGAIVVDHGLQAGSAEVAERAAAQARGLGLDPVVVRRVDVRRVDVHRAEVQRVDAGSVEGNRVEAHGAAGEAAGPEVAAREAAGPEAAAREARYEAFVEVAGETGAAAILTAHTRDDQAEQVLLSLARGSGLRSVAGIPPNRPLAGGVVILRPFLTEEPEITRAATELACEAEGLEFWRDPHNVDPSYARVRVRDRALPMLEGELGPGVAASLARTADLAREDADALDEMAEGLLAELIVPGSESGSGSDSESDSDRGSGSGNGDDESEGSNDVTVSVPGLAQLPAALRHRVIRLVARREFGAHLSREHTLAVAALITDWRGQGPINVPGIVVNREAAVLVFRALR